MQPRTWPISATMEALQSIRGGRPQHTCCKAQAEASSSATSPCLTAQLCREKHPSAELLIPAKLDLAEPASIRAFAKAYRAQGLSCHILINNAGANNLKEFFTSEGVFGLPQVGLLCRAQPCLQPCVLRACAW